MKQKLQTFLANVPNALASKRLSYIILGFFAFEALWIAVSAIYPQAFDEDFHFGIIRAYSHFWLPLLSEQPVGADAFGAVSRDPSYMYHYLMSFPYRVIAQVLHSTTEQVIALRVINVALFTSGLALFMRVLRQASLSLAATNCCLLIMTFIPVAPQLAGQINYDNLLLPTTALSCLCTFAVINKLKQRQLPLQEIIILVSVCLFTSLVKYQFVPIFLAIVLFVTAYGWRQLHISKQTLRPLLKKTYTTWLHTPKWQRYLWLVLLVLGISLFVQRDGINVVRYHDVAPDCSLVISQQQCSEYSVWIHDYLSHQVVVQKQVTVHPNPIGYLSQWLYFLWYRLFFAINGSPQFTNYPPLLLPAASFALMAIASLLAFARHGRHVLRSDPRLAFLGLVIAIYALALFEQGYTKYLDTGVLELMNGRYLFPILLPVFALSYLALRPWLRKKQSLTVILSVIMIICLLQGGGLLTFILRSDNSWNWPSQTVVTMNNGARRVLQPVIIEGDKSFSTNHWYFN